MDYLTIKYIGLLSSQLKNFRKKDKIFWNFRCPVCGDSTRNPSQSKRILCSFEGECFYKCWKCGYSCHFDIFLKEQNGLLYKEYLREKLFKPKEELTVRQPVIPIFKKYEDLNLFISRITSRFF